MANVLADVSIFYGESIPGWMSLKIGIAPACLLPLSYIYYKNISAEAGGETRRNQNKKFTINKTQTNLPLPSEKRKCLFLYYYHKKIKQNGWRAVVIL